jgi:hypothetical protein
MEHSNFVGYTSISVSVLQVGEIPLAYTHVRSLSTCNRSRSRALLHSPEYMGDSILLNGYHIYVLFLETIYNIILTENKMQLQFFSKTSSENILTMKSCLLFHRY